MRRKLPVAVPFSAGKCVAVLGVLLSLAALIASPAAAQSLNDLLGGGDSPLVPARQTEPKLTVSLTPQGDLEPGATLVLAIKAEYGPDAYTYSQNPAFGGATKITITEVYGIEAVDEAFTPDRPPKVAFEELIGQDLEKFHTEVTWTRKYRYAGNVPAEDIYAAGKISYQVCDKQNCRPLHEDFEAFVGESVESATITDEMPKSASAADPTTADVPVARSAQSVESGPNDEIAETSESTQSSGAGDGGTVQATATPLVYEIENRAADGSLPWFLGLAFFGGLILNVMPCVLPVLAIKLMSFVQQAGESRSRILALNLSYTLGVVGVFLVLASLAVTLQMSWGGLFQKPEFNLVMIGIVFAMALSMIGVFEIKLPGAVGAMGGQHREGLLGAFLTGIFATLLATPCTAPAMGTALTWSLKQEPAVVYLVWGVMGLGMASPYLLVAMVPAIARLLPRPGEWMLRFKELSGIVLMGAVVWLLRSLEKEVLVPVLFVLVGVAVALWMIGSLYGHASTPRRKWIVRGIAAGLLLLVGFFGSTQYQDGLAKAEADRQAMQVLLARVEQNTAPAIASDQPEEQETVASELPWQPFSTERLESLLQDGKPVMVDFSAEWCANCKVNEAVALNTLATARFVREHGITPLYADYTREDPEIKMWLDRFEAIGIPLTVVFPQRDPQDPVVPIILDGVFSQSKLLAALRKAVPENVALQERQSAFIEQTTR